MSAGRRFSIFAASLILGVVLVGAAVAVVAICMHARNARRHNSPAKLLRAARGGGG